MGVNQKEKVKIMDQHQTKDISITVTSMRDFSTENIKFDNTSKGARIRDAKNSEKIHLKSPRVFLMGRPKELISKRTGKKYGVNYNLKLVPGGGASKKKEIDNFLNGVRDIERYVREQYAEEGRKFFGSIWETNEDHLKCFSAKMTWFDEPSKGTFVDAHDNPIEADEIRPSYTAVYRFVLCLEGVWTNERSYGINWNVDKIKKYQVEKPKDQTPWTSAPTGKLLIRDSDNSEDES